MCQLIRPLMASCLVILSMTVSIRTVAAQDVVLDTAGAWRMFQAFKPPVTTDGNFLVATATETGRVGRNRQRSVASHDDRAEDVVDRSHQPEIKPVQSSEVLVSLLQRGK